MQTMYLLVLTLLGGCLSLFASAGWGAYSEKKLPATPVLFRWFVTGLLSSGLGAYAWLFGAGGDPTKWLESLGESLEVKEVMEGLTAAAGTMKAAATAGGAVAEKVAEAATDITVGMPTF